MKILLTGNGVRYNRGCEAIGITTIEALQRKFPSAKLVLLSFDPESDNYFKENYGVDVLPIQTEHKVQINIIEKILNKLNLLPIKQKAKIERAIPYLNQLETCDLVLSLGGDNYTDDYGIPYFFWELALLAKRLKKPFVIWGGTVGPFNSKHSIKWAKRGLSAVSLVTAREDNTIDYLHSLDYRGHIVRVFDTAFNLKPKTASMPLFERKAETVGFNISPIYHRYTNYSQQEIIDITVQFLLEIEKQYNILLIPHVMYPGAFNNDLDFMLLFKDRLNNVAIVGSDNDSRQLKYIISQCDYFIGARTHATIAAFSLGVPTLSLGYSMKAKGINEDLFGSNDFLIDSKDYSCSSLLSKFNFLVLNKEKYTGSLNEKIASAHNMIENGLDCLESLLESEV